MTCVSWNPSPFAASSVVEGGAIGFHRWEVNQASIDSSVTHIKLNSDDPPLPHDGSFLEHYPGLTSLDLGESNTIESDLKSLQIMTQLVSLSLGGGPTVIRFQRTDMLLVGAPLAWWQTDEGCGLAQHLPSLMKRDFSKCRWAPPALLPLAWRLTDWGLSFFSHLPLTKLDLGGCHFLTSPGLQCLRSMPLTSLSLRGCISLSDTSLECLQKMPLTDLDLAVCDWLSDEGLAHLRGLPITRLDLGGFQVSADPGLNFTPESLSKTLGGVVMLTRRLSLGSNLVTDEGLAALRGMPLKTLSLSNCKWLRDEALHHLEGMPLSALDLASCYSITDEGLRLLHWLPLTFLDLTRCPLVTPAGLAQLRARWAWDLLPGNFPRVSNTAGLCSSPQMLGGGGGGGSDLQSYHFYHWKTPNIAV